MISFDEKISIRLRPLQPIVLAFTASDTMVISSPVEEGIPYGESEGFEITIPDWTNSVTTTFSIISASGNTLFSITFGTSEDNQTIFIPVFRPFGNGSKVAITLGGTPGGSGGTVTVIPYVFI